MTSAESRHDQDAWRRLHELVKFYTKHFDISNDIKVTAHATERAVELVITERSTTDSGACKNNHKTTGLRNVDTMRKLARALNDACDFVIDSNPNWWNGTTHDDSITDNNQGNTDATQAQHPLETFLLSGKALRSDTTTD